MLEEGCRFDTTLAPRRHARLTSTCYQCVNAERGLVRGVKGEHVRSKGEVLLGKLSLFAKIPLLVRQVLWHIAPRASTHAGRLALHWLEPKWQAGKCLCCVRGMRATYYNMHKTG